LLLIEHGRSVPPGRDDRIRDLTDRPPRFLRVQPGLAMPAANYASRFREFANSMEAVGWHARDELAHCRGTGVVMKSLAAFLTLVAVAAVVATAAFGSTPRHSSILIRHQMSHCHAWSLNKAPFVAHVNAKLAVGGSITFTNDDVMSHRLIKTSGHTVTFTGSPAMAHMASTVKVTFAHAGTYRFTTKPGEDYMKGVTTTGEDNVLTLTVTVS
jgi:plastocyanin